MNRDFGMKWVETTRRLVRSFVVTPIEPAPRGEGDTIPPLTPDEAFTLNLAASITIDGDDDPDFVRDFMPDLSTPDRLDELKSLVSKLYAAKDAEVLIVMLMIGEYSNPDSVALMDELSSELGYTPTDFRLPHTVG